MRSRSLPSRTAQTLRVKPYLREISLKPGETSPAEYPFIIPAVQHLGHLMFDPDVTFLVGENGTGKSTLLEAIAIALGFNAEGGNRNFRFSTRASHSELYKHLHLVRSYQRPRDSYFLSFFALVMRRFRGKGLYILDEPEAALSPKRQLMMLRRMRQLVHQDSQFIVATHSPILLAYPNARIFVLSEQGYAATEYLQTEHYRRHQHIIIASHA